ncbi:helix-turn-helix domain-containing protein [Microbacterium sp. NPDC056052]|uniref:helix-turn-helix domain-containing protein n=1 Tax=Microbacterium sp. NPDC056052 TaxID=3345695 RepID=UPI0035E39005
MQILERAFGVVRIRVCRVTGGGLSLSAPEGTVSLHGVRRGRLALRGGETPFELTAKHALLMSGTEATLAVLRPVELVSVSLPALPASHHGVAPGVRRVSGNRALVRGVLSFAADVAGAPVREDAVQDAHIEALLGDMIARLAAEGDVQDAPEPLRQATAAILRAYPDPDLGSRRIAEAANLSVRQLERLFRAQGTSIAAEVRRVRIDAAVRLIADDPAGSSSIDEIARRIGFSGGSSLARAMVREGLPAPSALRKANHH